MMQRKTYLLTGAAGFIGSNLAHHLASKGDKVVVYDKLTYAGNKASLDGIPTESLAFVNGDICDTALVYKTLAKYGVDAVFHLAAESYVDRSIDEVYGSMGDSGYFHKICPYQIYCILHKNRRLYNG